MLIPDRNHELEVPDPFVADAEAVQPFFPKSVNTNKSTNSYLVGAKSVNRDDMSDWNYSVVQETALWHCLILARSLR
jgi:hypothetical protein